MTFDSAAWAINGPEISASLARRAEYAATSGENGVVLKDDLKVSQLDVPGVGVQISAGVGVVVNDYQDIPNEAYVVSNGSTHTFSEMPDASLSDKRYLLAIVIGDPDFSQVGHPWMPSTPLEPEEIEDFEYVRPTLIEVAAGVTTLDVDYPALIVAAIDIPASTTTILDSMITDLRVLANPRQKQDIFVSPDTAWSSSSSSIPSGSTYGDWGHAGYDPTVKVPSWATRAILVANLNGINLANSATNVQGAIRAKLGSVVGPLTSFNLPERTGAVREYLQTAGEFDVTSIAGTTVNLRVQGYESAPASPGAGQRLTLDGWSQVIFDVRFFEE